MAGAIKGGNEGSARSTSISNTLSLEVWNSLFSPNPPEATSFESPGTSSSLTISWETNWRGDSPALNALLDAVVKRIEANGSQEYFVEKEDSPDHTVDLPAFLGLEDDSKEIRPGWRLVSADALRDQLVYLFDSPLGGQVRLYAAGRDPEREAFASTDLFNVWFDVEGEFPETDEARQELDAFLGQVVERLDKSEPEHSPFV